MCGPFECVCEERTYFGLFVNNECSTLDGIPIDDEFRDNFEAGEELRSELRNARDAVDALMGRLLELPPPETLLARNDVDLNDLSRLQLTVDNMIQAYDALVQIQDGLKDQAIDAVSDMDLNPDGEIPSDALDDLFDQSQDARQQIQGALDDLLRNLDAVEQALDSVDA